jgi:hypothetical protein
MSKESAGPNPFCLGLTSPREEHDDMKKNLGTSDRWLRGLAGSALLLCSFLAPLPLLMRAAGLGSAGVYLLFTALAGTCLGYKLIGRSTCPVETGS